MQTAAEMNLTGPTGQVYALAVASELLFAATQVSFHLFFIILLCSHVSYIILLYSHVSYINQVYSQPIVILYWPNIHVMEFFFV